MMQVMHCETKNKNINGMVQEWQNHCETKKENVKGKVQEML